MTIDERLELERLAERTDAIAELLAQMHRDNEKQFAESERIFRERFLENEKRLGQLMDTMNRLGRILENHDQQIDDHDDRLNQGGL